jgi:hypothetical protein
MDEREIVKFYFEKIEELRSQKISFFEYLIKKWRLKFEFKQNLTKALRAKYPDELECERELRKTLAKYRYL